MLQPCGYGLTAAFHPHEAVSSILPLAGVLTQAHHTSGKRTAGTLASLPSLGCLVHQAFPGISGFPSLTDVRELDEGRSTSLWHKDQKMTVLMVVHFFFRLVIMLLIQIFLCEAGFSFKYVQMLA